MDIRARALIHSFCHIVNLTLNNARRHWDGSHRISLFELHGLSPVLGSLDLLYQNITHSRAFEFICSFPLLEGLFVYSDHSEDGAESWNAPAASQKFTGALHLRVTIRPFVRRLTGLIDGPHFSLDNPTPEMVQEWHALDQLLVHLRTPHSFKVMRRDPRGSAHRLLPELVEKGSFVSWKMRDHQWNRHRYLVCPPFWRVLQ
jgi:hypothetical protein